MKRLLIAGSGQAASACIEQLSKLKHGFLITLLRGSAGSNPSDVPEWDEERLRGLGVDIRGTACIEAFDRYARVVRGCDGSRITFERLVLAADSDNPRLARAAGLEVASGVILNDFQQTSDAHIYALGPGAEHRGAIYSDRENIEEQARVLAAHLSGLLPSAFAPVRSMIAAAGMDDLSVTLTTLSAPTTSASLPASSAGSEPRWEARTPELEDLPALAGAA